MDELSENLRGLENEMQSALKRLNVNGLETELEHLQRESATPDFWQNTHNAQAVMKKIGALEQHLAPWQRLQKDIADLSGLVKLNDSSLKGELGQQYQAVRGKFESLKEQLKLTGPYDDHGAIVSIYAGAGGTDAQDWTQILFRMYTRFFENNRWEYKLIEESPGEEAGLKAVVLEVDGAFVYGKLKGERGVHRLVRLSPFNADNLRQTSFAKVEVAPKINAPEELELDENDLKIDVYRSGGHGGQSVNTTDSAVRVTHLPTGLSVAIQNERSQLQNRETALSILRSRLAQLQLEQHKEKLNGLKGPNQSAEWGNQIRSYVLHPYKQVKDLRTRFETSDVDGVLNGKLDGFIDAYLEQKLGDV